MRKLVVPAAVLAGLVMTAPAAVAQEREPVSIGVAKACGVVTLTFVNPNRDVAKTHVFRWNAVAGNVVTDEGSRTGSVTVPPARTVKETIRFVEDEFGGVAAVTVAVSAGPDSDIQPRLDIYPVDTDCGGEPAPTTTPAPSEEPEPTEDPEPTETPDPTTTPPADDEDPLPGLDLDCGDFPLADGRTAQQILNETPTADPHGLDADQDRIACEPGQDTAPDGNGGDFADNDEPVGDVVTPSGGIATGVGPA